MKRLPCKNAFKHRAKCRRTRWTARQEATAVAMRRAERPLAEIAARLGKTETAVQTRLSKLGVRLHPAAREWTDAEDRRLIEFRRTGVKQYVVARRLGRTPAAVSNRVAHLKLPPYRWPLKPGELAQGVRRLHAMGLNDREIAERLGVRSRSGVWDCRQRLGLAANCDYRTGGRLSGAARRAKRDGGQTEGVDVGLLLV